MKPLLSIISLVYNHESFLRESLDGLVMQKTNFEFEIIIHDDASSDKSKLIIEEYRKKYPNIIKTIYQSENQKSKGNGIVTKIVMNKAKGKYIAFCEGDDFWTNPHKLQKQVELLESNPRFSACFHPVYWMENGKIADELYTPILIKEFYDENDVLENVLQNTICSTIYKKSSIENLSSHIENLNYGDNLLNILTSLCGKIGFINFPMATYRRHSGGVYSGANEYDRVSNTIEDLKYIKEKFNFNRNISLSKRLSSLYEKLALLANETPDKLTGKENQDIYTKTNKNFKTKTQIEVEKLFQSAQLHFNKGNFSEAKRDLELYQSKINYNDFESYDNRVNVEPKLSIIIVAYNTNQLLLECINSVNNNEEKRFEIIVVDNGRNEAIEEQLKTLPLLYIKCSFNYILSEGRNIGVNFAKGNIVAFLDDDAIVPHDYTCSILNAFQKYDIHGFRGKVLPKSTSKNNNSAHHYDLGETPFPHVCDTEGNSAFKKESFLAVSGMDPLLFGGEGLDLSFRLFRKYDNYSVIYWPDTIIYHDYASSDDKLKKKVKRHEVMNSYLFQNYGDEFKKWYYNIIKFKNDELSIQLGNSLIDEKLTDLLGFQPLISICIPTYNRVNFLERSLKSAFLQTYSNFEVIIIDDGSTDGTENYIKSINNPRLKFYRKKHEGAPAARNLAIEKSEGDYILWLDSDDEIRDIILDEYVKILNAQKEVDIVYCNLVRREEKEIPYFNFIKSYNGKISPFELLFGSPIPNIGCLVKKRLYYKVGKYNLSFKRAQDYEFWSRAVKTANVRHCPKFLATQHKHNFGHLSPTDIKTVDYTYEIKILNNILTDYSIEEIFNEVNWNDLSEESKKEYYSDAYITIAKAFFKWDKLDKVYDFTKKAYEITPKENIKKILASFENINLEQNNIENTPQLHIKEVFTKAKKFIDDKKLKEALVMIESTIQLYDQNNDVLKSNDFASIINLAGNICLETVDLDLAMQYFELELNYVPTSSKACTGLGEVFLRNENFESSKTMFEWAVINDETNFTANQFLLEINKILGFSETHNALIKNENLKKNNMMEGNNIFISILIPTYNRAKFLSKTIESALDQDYNNYEIIILDDGSTDNTELVIKQYLENAKIKYIKKEHTNAPDTRNKLIDLATGDYILWLDSDDNLNPKVLKKYVDTLVNFPTVNMVYGNIRFTDFNGNEHGISNYTDWYNNKKELWSKIISGQPFPNPFMLIKKSLYKEVGNYNTEFTRAHDYEFNSRLVTGANINMKIINEVIGNYIIHDENLTTTKTGEIDTSFEIKILDSLVKLPLDTFFPNLDWIGKESESNSISFAEIALQYKNYNSYEKAIQFYQKSLDAYPYNSVTYYGLGEIALEMNKLEEAKNLFNQAANYSSTIDYAQDNINTINEKLSLEFDENSIYSLRGKQLLIDEAEKAILEGDLTRAKIQLNKILDANPIFIEALNNLVVIQIMESSIEEALMNISKIIEIDPQNNTALENLKYLEENVTLS